MEKNNTTASSTPQAPVQPVAQPAQAKPEVGKKKKKTGLIWGIIGGVVVAIIAIVLVVVFVILPKNATSDDATVNALLKGSLIPVEVNDKYGYMDTNGNMVINAVYDDAEPFIGDYAEVEIGYDEAIIDRSGNVKMLVSGSSEYLEDSGLWIIDGKLYDGNLNQISSDEMKVGTIYDAEDSGYFEFTKPDSKKVGIMDAAGKVIFEVDDTSEYGGGVRYSEVEYEELTPYCGVNAGSKYYIIGCANGEVVTEIDAARFDYLGSDENNIFWLNYDINDAEHPDKYKYYYIQDGKVMIETTPDKYSGGIDDSLYSGYIAVRSNEGERKYFDVCAKKYVEKYYDVDCKLNRISSSNEDFSDYSEYKIDGGIITKGDKVVIPSGTYDRYKPLPKLTYLYLKALGKDYIFAERNNNTVLVDLSNGKELFDFGNRSIDYSDGSTFVEYRTNGVSYYNLVTGKTFTPDYDGYTYEYADYMIIKNANGDYDYYNTDFKKFYTRD